MDLNLNIKKHNTSYDKVCREQLVSPKSTFYTDPVKNGDELDAPHTSKAIQSRSESHNTQTKRLMNFYDFLPSTTTAIVVILLILKVIVIPKGVFYGEGNPG